MNPSRRVVLAIAIVIGALVVLNVVLPPLIRALPPVSPLVSTAFVAAVVAYIVGTVLVANLARLRVRRPPRPSRPSVPPRRSAQDFIEEFERRNRG